MLESELHTRGIIFLSSARMHVYLAVALLFYKWKLSSYFAYMESSRRFTKRSLRVTMVENWLVWKIFYTYI